MADESAYQTGWPPVTAQDGCPVIYEILFDGRPVQAYVDVSQQFRADGKQWRDPETKEMIPNHRVTGWRGLPE